MSKLKNAEEYLEGIFERPFDLNEDSIEYDFYKIIKEAQKNAWNAALDEAVKNAELIDINGYEECTPYLDDSSILKLKIK